MPAQKNEMKVLFNQFAKGGEPTIIGHGEMHPAIPNHGVQGLQNGFLFRFNIQASLFWIYIIGQGGEQQNLKGSLGRGFWVLRVFLQTSR